MKHVSEIEPRVSGPETPSSPGGRTAHEQDLLDTHWVHMAGMLGPLWTNRWGVDPGPDNPAAAYWVDVLRNASTHAYRRALNDVRLCEDRKTLMGFLDVGGFNALIKKHSVAYAERIGKERRLAHIAATQETRDREMAKMREMLNT